MFLGSPISEAGGGANVNDLFNFPHTPEKTHFELEPTHKVRMLRSTIFGRVATSMVNNFRKCQFFDENQGCHTFGFHISNKWLWSICG